MYKHVWCVLSSPNLTLVCCEICENIWCLNRIWFKIIGGHSFLKTTCKCTYSYALPPTCSTAGDTVTFSLCSTCSPSDPHCHGRAPGSILSIILLCAQRCCTVAPLDGSLVLSLFMQAQRGFAHYAVCQLWYNLLTAALKTFFPEAYFLDSLSNKRQITQFITKKYFKHFKVSTLRLSKINLPSPLSFSHHTSF